VEDQFQGRISKSNEEKMMSLYRVQARQKGVVGYINCMRGSWLGNPFPLNRYSREMSLINYEGYLKWRIRNDFTFSTYLMELGEKSKTETVTLGCTCKIFPHEDCHVDLLIKHIKKLSNTE